MPFVLWANAYKREVTYLNSCYSHTLLTFNINDWHLSDYNRLVFIIQPVTEVCWHKYLVVKAWENSRCNRIQGLNLECMVWENTTKTEPYSFRVSEMSFLQTEWIITSMHDICPLCIKIHITGTGRRISVDELKAAKSVHDRLSVSLSPRS